MKLIFGDRISQQGTIRLGCSAVIINDTDQTVLLTQRTDNGRWCLPGGKVDPGESVAECCVREVFEETGLHVRVKRLVGVYSDPHMLVEYPDNRLHTISLNFETEVIGGTLGLSDETTDCEYFSLEQIKSLDLIEPHIERISDTFAQQPEAFIR